MTPFIPRTALYGHALVQYMRNGLPNLDRQAVPVRRTLPEDIVPSVRNFATVARKLKGLPGGDRGRPHVGA